MIFSLRITIFSLFLISSFSTPLAAEKIRKLTVFQTSDIHSQIEGETSGWLKIAGTIKRYRKLSGKENSLLIDCGDTIPGSIIGSISKGEAASSVLKALEYDAWIIGNHDLGFGLGTLTKISEESEADILAANLRTDKTKGFASWKTYKRNGINAAVIGLTSPHIDEWLWGNKRKPYQVMPTIQTIDNLMPEILKSGPDVIILAIHHGRFSPKRLKGFNISRIAEKFPQIDLILGGHSHQDVPGEKCGRSTWYVEAGCHAEKFGWIEITVDTENKNVIEIESKLIPVEDNEDIDLTLYKSIEEWEKKAKLFSIQKVGFTNTDITPTKKKELFAPMNELFCKAISTVSKSQMAFHGSVDRSATFSKDITEKDVFDTMQYEDTVCTLDLTAEDLRIIIQEQIKKKEKGRFQSPFGINIIIHKDNSISLTLPTGEPLDDKKRYRSAFSSYALAGAGGRFPELKKIAVSKTSKGKDSDISVRDALREYIRKNSPLSIKTINRINYNNSD